MRSSNSSTQGRVQMQREKFKPNNITFLGLRSACNHCGLVEEGKFWFRKMEYFGLIPQIEHYGGMVDLLGRAVCSEEAEKLIKSMAYDVHGLIFSSFLFACGYYEDVTRANKILEPAIKLEPWNAGNYVMHVDKLVCEKKKVEKCRQYEKFDVEESS
ncbi:pentatricopeptide repeat-containing protein At2g44880-like [Argentina anserina]|uniref:pentatricopeptide repeat-containing protein At2g44880-like n=1 Tax=Argentina anserina TaxID=57926 RepID=UPI0021767930|nr:pentatricopeptide repeat-containing protein At2g44880-like [Potentilla anserina]